MTRAVDAVRQLSPNALPYHIADFENGDGYIAAAGLTTPARLADFLATCAEETGDFTIKWESGNYSAARMVEVWPKRFPTRASAEPYAHNAEKLFNLVYANRMGNGAPETGDGFKYRGRDKLQTTGKDDYREAGEHIGVDLVAVPDNIFLDGNGLRVALWEWQRSDCAKLSDAGNFRELTRRVNGGYTNYSERLRQRQRYQKAVGAKVDLLPSQKAARRSAAVATVHVASPAAEPVAHTGLPLWGIALSCALMIAVVAGAYLYEIRPIAAGKGGAKGD